MTIERAAEILSQHKHRGLGGWGCLGVPTGKEFVSNIYMDYTQFSLLPFEAIAIAEKYERQDRERLDAEHLKMIQDAFRNEFGPIVFSHFNPPSQR